MLPKSNEELVKSTIRTIVEKLPREEINLLFESLSRSTHRKLIDEKWVVYWEIEIEGVSVKYYPETNQVL